MKEGYFSNHWQRLDREVCHSHSLSKNLEKQAQEKDYGIPLVLSRFPPRNPYLSLPPVLHGSTILGSTSCLGHREDPWASTPERDLPGLWRLIKRSPELFSKGLVSLCHIKYSELSFFPIGWGNRSRKRVQGQSAEKLRCKDVETALCRIGSPYFKKVFLMRLGAVGDLQSSRKQRSGSTGTVYGVLQTSM